MRKSLMLLRQRAAKLFRSLADELSRRRRKPKLPSGDRAEQNGIKQNPPHPFERSGRPSRIVSTLAHRAKGHAINRVNGAEALVKSDAFSGPGRGALGGGKKTLFLAAARNDGQFISIMINRLQSVGRSIPNASARWAARPSGVSCRRLNCRISSPMIG